MYTYQPITSMQSILKITFIAILFPFFADAQYDFRIGTGSMWLDGDVDILCGLGSINTLDVGLDYQLTNYFYLSGSLGYGNTKGLDQYKTWGFNKSGFSQQNKIYEDYKDRRFAAYHSTNIAFASLGLSYKLYMSTDNVFLSIGFQAGYGIANTYLNLYNDENQVYELPTISGRPTGPLITPNLFDDSFESKLPESGSLFHYGPHVSIGFNVNSKGYVGISTNMYLTNSDNQDGIAYRVAFDNTVADIICRTTLMYTHRFGTFNW